MEYMFWSGSCISNYDLAMAQHNTSISPYIPTGHRRHLLHGFTTTFFVYFKGFMVDVKAWACCTSSLTRLVCTPAMPLIA
jgi:hypothetical protein